jgi:hypothetical protein
LLPNSHPTAHNKGNIIHLIYNIMLMIFEIEFKEAVLCSGWKWRAICLLPQGTSEHGTNSNENDNNYNKTGIYKVHVFNTSKSANS